MDFQYEQDDSIKQRSNPIRSPAAASENINSGGFDCNICLESALDPVVTLCGHLYCWPCIYKWLQVQNSTAVDSTDQPKCPVCKTSISHSSVVPLYGRGSSSSSSSSSSEARKRLFNAAIPQRPAAIATTSSALPINAASVGSYPHHPPPPPNPHHQLHPNIYNPQQPLPYFQPPLQPYFTHSFGGYAPMGQQGIGNTTMTSFYSPTIGMFGDMVCSGIFGSSGPNWFATNHSLYSSPRRVRRQEMQVEKSLWRFYTFLVCVAVLCLLLF